MLVKNGALRLSPLFSFVAVHVITWCCFGHCCCSGSTCEFAPVHACGKVCTQCGGSHSLYLLRVGCLCLANLTKRCVSTMICVFGCCQDTTEKRELCPSTISEGSLFHVSASQSLLHQSWMECANSLLLLLYCFWLGTKLCFMASCTWSLNEGH